MASKLDWNINGLDLLTLFVVTVGGGIGFFLVDQQKVELSSAQKTLTEIQTNLARIDSRYAELNAAMESQNQQITAQVALADLITDIQPRPSISSPSGIASKGGSSYVAEYRIENKGRFPLFTTTPDVSLLVTTEEGTEIQLVHSKDFALVAPLRPGMIGPKESVLSTIYFDLYGRRNNAMNRPGFAGDSET